VTGFVGPESKPVPLSPEEVEHMLHPEPASTKTDIAIGQEVRILSGTLENFVAVVQDLDPAANKVTVKVTMFGREQLVDLDLDQVVKVED
jgi:transcriptional antiterminator NusG